MITMEDLGPIGLDSSSDGDVIDDFDLISNPNLGSSGGDSSAKKRLQKTLNESICSLTPSVVTTIGTNKKTVKRKRPMKKKLKSSSTNEKKAKLQKN